MMFLRAPVSFKTHGRFPSRTPSSSPSPFPFSPAFPPYPFPFPLLPPISFCLAKSPRPVCTRPFHPNRMLVSLVARFCLATPRAISLVPSTIVIMIFVLFYDSREQDLLNDCEKRGEKVNSERPPTARHTGSRYLLLHLLFKIAVA